MKFNFRTSLDFPPIFSIGDSLPLNIVSQTKLLGIIISEDLKWSSHVDFMCKKALNTLWLLRRLRILKLDTDIVLDRSYWLFYQRSPFYPWVWSSCVAQWSDQQNEWSNWKSSEDLCQCHPMWHRMELTLLCWLHSTWDWATVFQTHWTVYQIYSENLTQPKACWHVHQEHQYDRNKTRKTGIQGLQLQDETFFWQPSVLPNTTT